MGITIPKNAGEIVKKMEEQLRGDLLKKDGRPQEEKLWENTYVARQVKKRREGGEFTLKDHIRAMVYAMWSGGAPWERLTGQIDPQTGQVGALDKAFFEYDTDKLLKCEPEKLQEELKNAHCAFRFPERIEALLSSNIPKLQEIEKEHGSIDAYYQKYIEIDGGLMALVTALSAPGGKDKMEQLGVPLACEYLRNAGHDIPKPDEHICRILGSGYLAFSDKLEVPHQEAVEIVTKLAKLAGKSPAETDYILWAYCADGHGEVCAKQNPKCEICAAKVLCRRVSE